MSTCIWSSKQLVKNILLLFVLFYSWQFSGNAAAAKKESLPEWRQLAERGLYDEAVLLATDDSQHNSLKRLIDSASVKDISKTSQWRAFVHYKPTYAKGWLSQVDSPQFFLSNTGKRSPEHELHATLAALFSTTAKSPLRLTAYCRFVARRFWLSNQLPELLDLLPVQSCPEFEQYYNYLNAEVLTLIFPSAHPNSPSSAFGHTLLRIDKRDQSEESKLLNMSLNFAADVPVDTPPSAYAIKGLTGGFEGRFRLLPYHIKLREYGQIENRDTWEYELDLEQEAVDLIIHHAYEMLISHFDYYFFSENCSYHLLSLLEVAFPDAPITDSFTLWTIPIDTIRKLDEIGLATAPRFVPSSIRKLRARQNSLDDDDVELALQAIDKGIQNIESTLEKKSSTEQVALLDLIADYERYQRIKDNPNAQGTNAREKLVLSRRSKLGLTSAATNIQSPAKPPHVGHGTARLGLDYQHSKTGSSLFRISFRPAYHDFKDPSVGFGNNAAIELGLISAAYDQQRDRLFIDQFRLINIESLEPIDKLFKPISWRTGLQWTKPDVNDSVRFTWNVGAGITTHSKRGNAVLYVFAETDFIHDRSLQDQTQLRIGPSVGMHWHVRSDLKFGVESQFKQQLGGDSYEAYAELWGGFAIAPNLSLNIELGIGKRKQKNSSRRLTAGVRHFF